MKNPFNREKTPKTFDQDEANKRMGDLFGDYARTNYALAIGFAAIVAAATITNKEPVITPVELVGGVASLYGATQRARALGSARTFRRKFGFWPKLGTAAEALVPPSFPATLPAVTDSAINLLQHQTTPNIIATSAWGALAVGGLVTDIVRKVKLPGQNYPSPYYQKPATTKPEQNPDYEGVDEQRPSNLQEFMDRQNAGEPQQVSVIEVVQPMTPPVAPETAYSHPVAHVTLAEQPSTLAQELAQYTNQQHPTASSRPVAPQSYDTSAFYPRSPESN